jgi:hypothetical protein
MTSPNQMAVEYLRSLGDQRFWGTVSFRLQSGEVIHILKEESLKPAQLQLIPDHRRDHADSDTGQ